MLIGAAVVCGFTVVLCVVVVEVVTSVVALLVAVVCGFMVVLCVVVKVVTFAVVILVEPTVVCGFIVVLCVVDVAVVATVNDQINVLHV